MWLEDRYLEMMENPDKLARFFKIAWIAAYSMLILGAILIIWVLFSGKY